VQPLLQRKNNEYYILWVCVCGLCYPACNAHVPYRLWHALVYNIFPNYLINGTNFGKTIAEHKTCVLIFSTSFVSNISHYKKKWARYQKWLVVFMWSTRYFCPVVMKLEFSQQFLEEYWNIKFHENPSSEGRVVPCGRTDWRTDMRKLIVASRNFMKVPKN